MKIVGLVESDLVGVLIVSGVLLPSCTDPGWAGMPLDGVGFEEALACSDLVRPGPPCSSGCVS